MALRLDKGIFSHGLVLMNSLIGILISFALYEAFDGLIRGIILCLSIAIYILYLLKTNTYLITSKVYGIALGLVYGFYLIVISTFRFSIENILALIFLYGFVILILGISAYTIVRWRAINILLEWILLFEFFNWLNRLIDMARERNILLVIFIIICLIGNTAYLICLFIKNKRLKKEQVSLKS